MARFRREREESLVPEIIQSSLLSPLREDDFRRQYEPPYGGQGEPEPQEITPPGQPDIYTAGGRPGAMLVQAMTPGAAVREAIPAAPIARDAPQPLPDATDPSVMAGEVPEKGPGFGEQLLAGIKRFGGNVGDFLTSDTGKMLLSAAAVGLAGIRNPRDQGRMQDYLMQQHFAGVQQRREAKETQGAMEGLMTVLDSANKAAAAGDYDSAINFFGQAMRNPMVMRNPAAVNYLLQAQSQLGQRAGQRRGLRGAQQRALTGGGATELGPIAPRQMSIEDILESGDLDLIKSVGPLLQRENKPVPHWDAKRGLFALYDPATGQITTKQYGDPDLPESLTIENLSKEVRGVLDRAGVHIPSLVSAYNKKDPKAIEIMGWAASQVPEGGEKSEQERSAAAEVAEEEKLGKVKFLSDVERRAAIARRIQERKVEVAEKGGYAGAKGRQEADLLRTQGQANRFFFDRRTQVQAPATMSVGDLQKDPRYVEVEPNTMQGLNQMGSGLTIAREMADIVRRRRDLFPEKVTDINVKTIAGLMAPGPTGRLDPDVARMKTLALAIPNLIRALGDTANIAVAERTITQGGLGLEVQSRQSAEAQLRTLMRILNESLRKRGFEPINADELLRGESDGPSFEGIRLLPPRGRR